MIRLVRPYLRFEEVQAQFSQILESGTLTRGPWVQQLSAELCSLTQSEFAFPTSSATTALYACLKALGIGPGDEVLVSDFSFPATANVVEESGARPLFVDVCPQRWTMDASLLDQAWNSRIRAVIFVDALGNPSGIEPVMEWCRKKQIPLIEDAACSLGSTVRGRPVGSIADLTCFSFHPRKLLTCGEGGAITTSNPDYARTLSVKLAHGGVPSEGRFNFVDSGYNFRLPELQSAMLLQQLKFLDEIVVRRQSFWKFVAEALAPLGFTPQYIDAEVDYNVQSLCFRVPKGSSRDAWIARLRERGMESTLGTYAMSATAYYSSKYGQSCPVSRELEAQTLTLPCHDDVRAERVVEIIRSAL